ncbi:MAG: hypothetical protein ABJL54_16025 [Halioglobus sp.]
MTNIALEYEATQTFLTKDVNVSRGFLAEEAETAFKNHCRMLMCIEVAKIRGRDVSNYLPEDMVDADQIYLRLKIDQHNLINDLCNLYCRAWAEARESGISEEVDEILCNGSRRLTDLFCDAKLEVGEWNDSLSFRNQFGGAN